MVLVPEEYQLPLTQLQFRILPNEFRNLLVPCLRNRILVFLCVLALRSPLISISP
jgi:hypothetical protein